jgi:hypothetical protein
VKVEIIDAECSGESLITINQMWWCHKPSQCRDFSAYGLQYKLQAQELYIHKSVNDDELHYEFSGLWASQS